MQAHSLNNTETTFQKICRLAIAKDKDTLLQLKSELDKFENGFNPIMQLAYDKEEEAVQFLITTFKIRKEYAIIGAARGNHRDYTLQLTNDNPDYLNQAVQGAARAGHIDFVLELIARSADIKFACWGAGYGNQEKLALTLLAQATTEGKFYELRNQIVEGASKAQPKHSNLMLIIEKKKFTPPIACNEHSFFETQQDANEQKYKVTNVEYQREQPVLKNLQYHFTKLYKCLIEAPPQNLGRNDSFLNRSHYFLYHFRQFVVFFYNLFPSDVMLKEFRPCLAHYIYGLSEEELRTFMLNVKKICPKYQSLMDVANLDVFYAFLKESKEKCMFSGLIRTENEKQELTALRSLSICHGYVELLLNNVDIYNNNPSSDFLEVLQMQLIEIGEHFSQMFYKLSFNHQKLLLQFQNLTLLRNLYLHAPEKVTQEAVKDTLKQLSTLKVLLEKVYDELETGSASDLSLGVKKSFK